MSDLFAEVKAWHCPNCAERLDGVKDDSGSYKAVCRKCGTKTVMMVRSRRKQDMAIFLPKQPRFTA